MFNFTFTSTVVLVISTGLAFAGEESCTQEMGADQAQTLSSECRYVTSFPQSISCDPDQNSCKTINQLIADGCKLAQGLPNYPNFCN